MHSLQSLYSPLNETLYHNNDLLNTCMPMRKDQQTRQLTVASVCDVFRALKTQFTWHASKYKVYKLHLRCIFVFQKEALKRRVTTDKEAWLLCLLDCICWIVSVGLCLLQGKQQWLQPATRRKEPNHQLPSWPWTLYGLVSLKRLGPADLEVVLKWGVAFG